MINNFNGTDIFGATLLNNFVSKLNQEFALYMKIGGTEYNSLVSSINTKNSSQDTEIGNIKTAATALTTRVTAAEGKIGALETNFTNLNSSHNGLSTTVDGIVTSLGNVQTSISSINNEITNAKTRIGALETTVTSMGNSLNDVSGMIDARVAVVTESLNASVTALYDDKADTIHTHAWSDLVSGLPATATRWPTWSEVTDKLEATITVQGLMSAADKVKLNGIAAGATNYSHPTGDGNLHVPVTSTTNNGKVLKAGATAGSIAWGFADWTEIANKPTSMPASDVSSWAKAGTKPTYTFSEISAKPTNISGYGITDALGFVVSSDTSPDALVLKGVYFIADVDKSFVTVNSSRITGTETTSVTQTKVPTEGISKPCWRKGTGNPIVWGNWEFLGGFDGKGKADIVYNESLNSIDFTIIT